VVSVVALGLFCAKILYAVAKMDSFEGDEHRLTGTETLCGLKYRHEFGAKIGFSRRQISAHNYTQLSQ
jgi:hypothetical protein